MLSLIYVSTADPGFTEAQLQELACQSAERNAARGVTGFLAYNSRNFMQLLEGDGDDVLETMRRIERDPRHGNITYIRNAEREQRECPEWAMQPVLTPLAGLGSASVFTGKMPREMELDTQVIFTSFASSLTAAQAAKHAEKERALRESGQQASND